MNGRGGQPTADQRVADLRRMRIIATLLLVFMTIVFVVASALQGRVAWLAYLRAFAEAGMVGACADWFAVVALFRHPLGIPIPHTAIVPRNKARIAGALGRFISNNFLTPKVLSERLRNIDAAQRIADWLSDPENASSVAQSASASVPKLVRVLPRERIATEIGNAGLRALTAMPAAPVAARLLAVIWAQGETQKLIERVLVFAEAALLKNRSLIHQKVAAGSSRWIPRWVDDVIAEKAILATAKTLTEMRNPAHPWRTELKTSIESLIERLSSDPELRASIESGKAALLESPVFLDQVNRMWSEIENRLPSEISAHTGDIAEAIEYVLLGAGRWLRDDPALKIRLNRWIRYFVRRTIAPRRAEIGDFVTRVVETWDANTLVSRMELQVGKDLQYVRINGTLVGGLVGLIIFALSKWFLPVQMP